MAGSTETVQLRSLSASAWAPSELKSRSQVRRAHNRSRLWTPRQLPYFSGRWIHCAPVRNFRAVASSQSVGPVRSRRTSRTSVNEALRKVTAPATSQRTDAPERYSRKPAPTSITLARTPNTEIRALMR